MCLRIAWLEPHGLDELRMCGARIARLQQCQPEVVVTFGKTWIAAHNFPKDIGGACGIVVLGEDQAQLYPRVGVFGVEADGFAQLVGGFIQVIRLGQGEAQIVVGFRQVGVGHHRLAKFLKRMSAVVLAPIEQPETGMGLGVIRFQLERFFERRVGTRRVVLALPSDAQIVVTGWQFRTLSGGVLKELKGVVEPLLLQRIDALEDEELRPRQTGTELVQPTEFIQLFLRCARLALSTQRNPQIVVGLFEIGLQLDRATETLQSRRPCRRRP